MPSHLEAKSELTTGKHGDRGRYVTTDGGAQIFLTQDGQIGQTGKSIDGGEAKPPVRNRPESIPKKTMKHEGGGVGIDLEGRLPMQQQQPPSTDGPAEQPQSDAPAENTPQYESPFVQSFAESIIANIRKFEQQQQQPQPAAPNPQDHPHHISKLPIPMRQSLLNWQAEITTLTNPVAWAKHGARGGDPKGVMKAAFDRQVDKNELNRVMGNLSKLIAVGDQQGVNLRSFIRHNNLIPRELAAKLKPSDLFEPVRDDERYRANTSTLADRFTAILTERYSSHFDDSKHPRDSDGKFRTVESHDTPIGKVEIRSRSTRSKHPLEGMRDGPGFQNIPYWKHDVEVTVGGKHDATFKGGSTTGDDSESIKDAQHHVKQLKGRAAKTGQVISQGSEEVDVDGQKKSIPWKIARDGRGLFRATAGDWYDESGLGRKEAEKSIKQQIARYVKENTMQYAAQSQMDIVVDRLIAAEMSITIEEYAARRAKNSPGQMSLFGDGLGGDTPLRTSARQQRLDWDESKVKRDDDGKFATSAGGAGAKAITKNEHGAHVITQDDIGGGGDGTFDRLHAGLASEIVQSKIAIGMKGIEGREYAIMQTKGGKWQLASRPGESGKDKPKPAKKSLEERFDINAAIQSGKTVSDFKESVYDAFRNEEIDESEMIKMTGLIHPREYDNWNRSQKITGTLGYSRDYRGKLVFGEVQKPTVQNERVVQEVGGYKTSPDEIGHLGSFLADKLKKGVTFDADEPAARAVFEQAMDARKKGENIGNFLKENGFEDSKARLAFKRIFAKEIMDYTEPEPEKKEPSPGRKAAMEKAASRDNPMANKYSAAQIDMIADRLIATELGLTTEQYAARRAKNSPGQMSLFGDGLGTDAPLRTSARQQRFDWDETKVKRDPEGKFAEKDTRGEKPEADKPKEETPEERRKRLREYWAQVARDQEAAKKAEDDKKNEEPVAEPEPATEPEPPAEPELKDGEKPEAEGMAPGVHAGMIPRDVAYNAHRWSSFVPEKRAAQEQEGFVSDMNAKYKQFESVAKTDEQKEILANEWPRFLERTKAAYMAKLYADSRTASSMITGGSNFPTASNRKKLDTAFKRLEEYLEQVKKGTNAIMKKLDPSSGGIRIGDKDSGNALTNKLAELQKFQEQMKSANVAVRKVTDSKATTRDKTAFKTGYDLESATKHVVSATGLSEKNAREILTPDYMGRLGFPDFSIRNNGANIRRVQQQIAAQGKFEEKAQAAESGEIETEFSFDGGMVHLDYDENRIRIKHDSKPDRDAIQKLKSRGWRWSPSNSAWQRQLTPDAKSSAQSLFGVKFENKSKKSDFNFDQHVKIAADDISKLRKSDVYRLIETVPDTDTAKMVADMIGQKRPDLKDEAMSGLYDYLQDAPTPGKYSAAFVDMIADRMIADELGLTVDQYAARKKSQKGQQEFEWITVHPNNGPGRPVMIDKKDGTIQAGMGGKFNGQKIGEIGKGGGADAKKDASREKAKPSASSDDIASLKAKDRFTDSKGQEWQVHKSRFGTIVAHPIVDGKPQVNQDSGVAFAIDDSSKSRNPDHRTDIKSVEKWENPDAPSPGSESPQDKLKQINSRMDEIASITNPMVQQEVELSRQLDKIGEDLSNISWRADESEIKAMHKQQLSIRKKLDNIAAKLRPLNKEHSDLIQQGSELINKIRSQKEKPADTPSLGSEPAAKSASSGGIDGYTKGMTPIAAANAKKALSKQKNYGGKVKTLSQAIDDAIASGATLEPYEYSKEVTPKREAEIKSEMHKLRRDITGNRNEAEKKSLTESLSKLGKAISSGYELVTEDMIATADGNWFADQIGQHGMKYAKHSIANKPKPAPQPAAPAYEPPTIPGQQTSLFGGDDLNTGQKSLFNMARPSKADQRAAKRDNAPAAASLLEQIDDEEKKRLDSRQSLPGQRDMFMVQFEAAMIDQYIEKYRAASETYEQFIQEQYRVATKPKKDNPKEPKTVIGNKGDRGRFITTEAGDVVFIEGVVKDGYVDTSKVKARKQREKAKATDPEKFVPVSDEDKAIVQAVGDRKKDVAYFKQFVDEAHGEISSRLREDTDAMRETLAQFGYTGTKLSGFLSSLKRRRDTANIPGFDEMLDYAQKHHRLLLTARPGESTAAGDEESMLFNRLKEGFPAAPKKSDPEVINRAWGMSGIDYSGLPSEWDAQEADSEPVDDELEDAPFSASPLAATERYAATFANAFRRNYLTLAGVRS